MEKSLYYLLGFVSGLALSVVVYLTFLTYLIGEASK